MLIHERLSTLLSNVFEFISSQFSIDFQFIDNDDGGLVFDRRYFIYTSLVIAILLFIAPHSPLSRIYFIIRKRRVYCRVIISRRFLRLPYSYANFYNNCAIMIIMINGNTRLWGPKRRFVLISSGEKDNMPTKIAERRSS